MATSPRWTRTELLVVLNLYHKLTFGQFHSRQPAVIDLAERLGRTPGSVAMKLGNLASLDPALKLRGIKGLAGASNLDRTVWHDFHEHPEEFVPQSEEALRTLFDAEDDSVVEVIPQSGIHLARRPPSGPTETASLVQVRRGQDYFRNAVINNFGGQCGITGLAVRELLIASHILPWSACPAERLNIRNGLCLSRLHDAAFDQGLIAFDDHLRLLLSPHLKDALPARFIADTFGRYAGTPLALPDDAVFPDPVFLARHRATQFNR
jgi:putative restriction endonuclease